MIPVSEVAPGKWFVFRDSAGGKDGGSYLAQRRNHTEGEHVGIVWEFHPKALLPGHWLVTLVPTPPIGKWSKRRF